MSTDELKWPTDAEIEEWRMVRALNRKIDAEIVALLSQTDEPLTFRQPILPAVVTVHFDDLTT